MNRFVSPLVLLWLIYLAAPAAAQGVDALANRLENSPRHHEWVEVAAAGGRSVRTWVVYPEVDSAVPVVIVIHENRGLTDWVRGVADQLAEVGYLALAPDLLSQTGPGGGGTESFGSQDAARDGIYRLSAEQVTADLDAVFKYAGSLQGPVKPVVVSGFCWGGSQAFAYAAKNPQLAAACVFYGGAPRDEADFAKIHAPVFGFYGGNDFRITGQVPDVRQRMEQHQKQYEAVVYEGAGHGFMRQGEDATDPNDVNRRARDEAWERWKQILADLSQPAAETP